MEELSPRYLSVGEFRALRYLADAVRAEYPAAVSVHAGSLAEGGYEITEVRDSAHVVLGGGGGGGNGGVGEGKGGLLLDGSRFPGIHAALSTALDAVGTPVTRLEGCTRCVLAVSLPGEQHTALEYWRDRLELALEADRDAIGVYLWDARSTGNNYVSVGAGVLHLPAGADVDAAAVKLREALERITSDWSVGVRLTRRDHDGTTEAGPVSGSDPWDIYESPDYDIDDEYDGRDEQGGG